MKKRRKQRRQPYTLSAHQLDNLAAKDPEIKRSIEIVADAAVSRATTSESRQSRFRDAQRTFFSIFQWARKAGDDEPPYTANSMARDTWLREFWRKEVHLEGVVNSVVSIDKNRGWNLTGGRNQVARYNDILREAEGGAGWRYFLSRASLSFYTADIGAITEVARNGTEGPAAALFNVDPVACQLSGDPAFPLWYTDVNAKIQKWGPMDFFRAVSLPSIDQTLHGLGWCAVSRCIELVKIMIGVYQYDQEKLGAKAPRGLLLLQNIDEEQWINAMRAREVYQSQKEQDYYSAIDVIAQMGPEPPDAKLFALSQLPDNFNIEITTKLLMYAYALSFGYDPIEFWPVEAGALGRGRETDIQHRKGTSKGAMDFILAYQDGLQRELPPALLFQFEERDVEGELKDAQVHEAWAKVAAAMSGILSQEQLMMYLADKGVIPAEWTPEEEDVNADAEGNDPENEIPIDETVNVDDEAEERAKRMKGRSKGAQRARRQFEEEILTSDRVRRACVQFPQEPIVRVSYPSGKVQTIFRAGEEAMKRRSFVAPDPAQHRKTNLSRPRVTRATLYDDDGVKITDEEVEGAISDGIDRVGRQFADLLEAESTQSEGNE